MNTDRARSIQRLLAAAGYYTGAMDGDIGTKTLTAVDKILRSHRADCSSDPTTWSGERRIVGAGQLVLRYAKYNIGEIDGYWGNQTEGAYLEWESITTTGKKLKLDTKPTGASVIVTPTTPKFPRQKDCTAFYGSPGSKANVSQLIQMDLPAPMRLDWNLDQKVKSVTIHQKCADSALKAMRAILSQYGEATWRKLGLDRQAGTYNLRKMRGGTSWSMHAYGCAWDFYAGPNGLTTRCPTALFCKDDYVPFFNIWEACGWTSLGRAIGRDWMHVQAASL